MESLNLEVIDKYKELLDRKDELTELTKANNAAIEELKGKIIDEMIEKEIPSISRGGFKYSLKPVTRYSKKGEETLLENQLDFFGTLREEGLGDLITETVNARTLQSAMTSYVTENGELSEGLSEVINVYDTYDISKLKDRSKAAQALK